MKWPSLSFWEFNGKGVPKTGLFLTDSRRGHRRNYQIEELLSMQVKNFAF
jgi:hypothetical protein